MNLVHLHIRRLLVYGAAAVLSGVAGGETNKIELTCRDNWGTVFADRDVELHLKVQSGEAFQGQAVVVWSAGGHAIARRELNVTAGPQRAAELTIAARIPPVRAGVRFPVTVSAALVPAGSREVVATWRKELMAFPDDPFADRRDWFKGLKLEIWDPENKTAALLGKAKLEYHRTDNLAAALGTTNTVVVGEGVSPENYPVLLRSLVEAASHGARILWLAPAAGNLSQVPGSAESALPIPAAMIFRGTEIISELDKKLDAAGWPPDGLVDVVRFQLHAGRNQAALQAVTAGTGWPWVELRYEGGGRLFLCGFPVVARWEATPTPRHLFTRLLERLTEKNRPDTPSTEGHTGGSQE